ncbi:unnamed protein product [Heligmosomoides polygyrus]|uniref:Transposase n=1 Tax=Heligmosomoides polygyrus TaxID=6339 RepID=A0A183FNX2_HELPZ|nr:unnamed protein product [Heligmosomoides polygyrus]
MDPNLKTKRLDVIARKRTKTVLRQDVPHTSVDGFLELAPLPLTAWVNGSDCRLMRRVSFAKKPEHLKHKGQPPDRLIHQVFGHRIAPRPTAATTTCPFRRRLERETGSGRPERGSMSSRALNSAG